MANVTIQIPTPLRSFTDDSPEVAVRAGTVDEALHRLTEEHPELRAHLYGDDGRLRNYVNVYLGEDNVRELDGEIPLSEDAVLSIVPSIAGGRPDGEGSGPETTEAAPRAGGEGIGTERGGEGDRPGHGSVLQGNGRADPSRMELSAEEIRRYGRHLTMPEVGMEGQKKLKAARVLLVGAGGLGSPAAMYLAAAGVGRIGLVDFDEVEFSNLHRQLLHDTDDVGVSKLESARSRLAGINPEVEFQGHDARLTSDNAMEILDGYDLVVDGSDNFPTRYLVNDACVFHGIPHVWGAIFRFEGQVSVFGLEDGPCYRCLFREPPPPGLVPSCAEAGVLGVLPGIVGSIQAVEAIKLILGAGRPLSGRLLLFDALETSFRELSVPRDHDCPVCGEDPEITELIDYEAFCGIPDESYEGEGVPEISVAELSRRLSAGEELQLVDVREDYEWEICNLGEQGARLVPLGQLPEHFHELDPSSPLVVHCRTGGRSARAVDLLRQAGFDNAVNLQGGIKAWAREIDEEMPTY